MGCCTGATATTNVTLSYGAKQRSVWGCGETTCAGDASTLDCAAAGERSLVQTNECCVHMYGEENDGASHFFGPVCVRAGNYEARHHYQ